MSEVERPARPQYWRPSEDYEYVAVVNEGWRLVSGKRCRRMQRRRACGKPSVAEVNRGRGTSYSKPDLRLLDSWWAYCGEHLYGNWIEDGQVMHWVLRKTGGES